MWSEPTTGFVGSGSTQALFKYRSMSDVVCHQPWASCLELPHYSLFVSASTGSGCVGRCQYVLQGLAFSSLELGLDL